MIIKHLEDTKKVQKIVQDGINTLVQQKLQAQRERDYYRIQVDYFQPKYRRLQSQTQTLTQENQSLQSQLNSALKERDTALQEKESQIQSILTNLNTSLNLNLEKPTLNNIITKIEALLKDPKVVVEEITDTSQIENLQAHNQQLQQTIISLEAQLTQAQEENKENTTATPAPVNEAATKESQEAVLRILKESNKISPIYQEDIKQIQQATTTQQLAKSYQNVINKGLIELKTIKTEKTELVQRQKSERTI